MRHRLLKTTVAAALAALAFITLSLSGCRLPYVPSGPADPVTEKPAVTAAPEGISGMVFSEVVSSNSHSFTDPALGSPDWIELCNTGGKAADISGWKIGESPDMKKSFTFPAGTVVEPGAFVCVLCAPDSSVGAPEGLHIAHFGISRSGERLWLSDGKGSLISVDVPALPEDVSYALGENGVYGYCAAPTFGAPNSGVYPTVEEATASVPHPAALKVSELVNGPEGWAELVNDSGEPITLSDYYLSDSEASPRKWRMPDEELAPGGLVVIDLTGADGDHAASFKLGSGDGTLFVFNGFGDTVDAFSFDPAMPRGVSAVRAGDGAAYTSRTTRGEANSDVTFPAIEWTDADPGSARLIINEVLADNKYGITDMYGDRSDWVELWNPTDSPVDMSDFYLSDDPADPLKWQLPKVSLLPGGYALIFLSGQEGSKGEIHAPFKLSNGETIVLSTLDGMVRDTIGIPEDLSPNISVGRNGNSEIRYYTAPTPNGPNNTYGLEKYADAGGFDAASLYISEVCAVAPARSGSTDWVELYNGSSSGIKLDGWRLTDDVNEPDKFRLSGTLSSGGFLVITCREGRSGKYTAPFSVSNTGDTLYLIDKNGAVRDVFQTGVTEPGMTSGRAAGSGDGERRLFSSPTKGYKNGAPLSGMAAEPVFSVTSLYHTSAFQLTITTSTAGASIRYTTDGSMPTSSSKLYSGPITVSSGCVISARAFREGCAPSPAAYSTYVFGGKHTLPVVCISLSGSDYSRMYRASVNENGAVTKGDEVACRMEYYVDGRLALTTGAGVRVSGASTALYPQKSLTLFFRAGYGRSSVDFPFFDGCKVTSFRSLSLRNSGQDADYAHIRDAYISRICRGMKLDVSYVQPVIVYINGEYRGIYDLKENMNEDYVASHHGVSRDTVEIARRNGYMIAGTKAQWNEMFTMCSQLDFSKEENYAKLKRLVDVDCVMDYLIARTYFYDWDMFNQKYWHTNDNRVKWRPVLYDSDYALFGNASAGGNLSAYFDPSGVSSAHGYITRMDIFCALKQNKGWRDAFITRYIYFVKYRFNKERALSVFDALVSEYRPEMARHIKRWHMPSSYEKWESEVSALRSCISRRPEGALKKLRQTFGLSEAQYREYERAADKLAGK